MTHLLLYKTPNSVSSEPGAAQRDILKRLSEANDQLPTDIAGVVHIGFEALGEDAIEQRRYEKIIETTRKFDRGRSKLEVIYCHYFAPDPAPNEVWAIDETVQWIGISGRGKPLEHGHLLPSDTGGRSGVHWIKNEPFQPKLGRSIAREASIVTVQDSD